VFNEYTGSCPLISGPQVLVYCTQVFPLGSFSSLLGGPVSLQTRSLFGTLPFCRINMQGWLAILDAVPTRLFGAAPLRLFSHRVLFHWALRFSLLG
jgi:hypothetical protein